MIDLHIHSTFSDGSLSPEALVELGAAAGLTAMTLTDHDTTGGVERFLSAAAAKGIRSISGIELSVDVPGVNVHILAYGCNPTDAALNEALDRVREGRHRRNVEILSKLSKLGCSIAWTDVLNLAGEEGLVARPHFAQALIKKGYARSKQDAFDRYLAKGAAAYADRFRLQPEEAIRLITAAGGIASLAHPSLCGLSSVDLSALIGRLATAGLAGIETYYTGHGEAEVSEYLGYVRTFGLIATGGSDFHGEMSPGIQIGSAYGSLCVPDEIFDGLLQRLSRAC